MGITKILAGYRIVSKFAKPKSTAKPSADEQRVMAPVAAAVLGRAAVIHTTLGDVHVKLFADECRRTVENFTVHSRNGYYDNLIFHRVIKQFMVQTGDPLGDGTGGESIYR